MERGALRVKGLQEHITISPARARTQTARCGDERANHEATVQKYTEDSKLKEILLSAYTGVLSFQIMIDTLTSLFPL